MFDEEEEGKNRRLEWKTYKKSVEISTAATTVAIRAIYIAPTTTNHDGGDRHRGGYVCIDSDAEIQIKIVKIETKYAYIKRRTGKKAARSTDGK